MFDATIRMGQSISSLVFDQWLAYVFDHPVEEDKPEWYFDPESDWWDGPAPETIQFLTHAFENAAELFEPYTDAQLNQGLWYLASNACSNHMLALLDESVPWPDRQRCLRSMVALYQQCFAPRCLAALGHLDELPANPLNRVCYMWWDILPVYGRPDLPGRQAFDQECLQVMSAALALPNEACQESALHGLGHWAIYYREAVAAIVDTYLKQASGIRKPLRQYALAARRGMVL
jgi:hypothetical protein